jgi:hypothetical protein
MTPAVAEPMVELGAENVGVLVMLNASFCYIPAYQLKFLNFV